MTGGKINTRLPKKFQQPEAVSFPCSEPEFVFTPGAFKPVIEYDMINDTLASDCDGGFSITLGFGTESEFQDSFLQGMSSSDVAFARPDSEWFMDTSLQAFGTYDREISLYGVDPCRPMVVQEDDVRSLLDHRFGESGFACPPPGKALSCDYCYSSVAVVSPRAFLSCPCFVVQNGLESACVETVDVLCDLLEVHKCVECLVCSPETPRCLHQHLSQYPVLVSAKDTQHVRLNVESSTIDKKFIALAYRLSDCKVYGYVQMRLRVHLPPPVSRGSVVRTRRPRTRMKHFRPPVQASDNCQLSEDVQKLTL